MMYYDIHLLNVTAYKAVPLYLLSIPSLKLLLVWVQKETVGSASLTPLDKHVRNHNKHNDVRKKEQEPGNRFVPILAKQIQNPSPEQNVENLEYEY